MAEGKEDTEVVGIPCEQTSDQDLLSASQFPSVCGPAPGPPHLTKRTFRRWIAHLQDLAWPGRSAYEVSGYVRHVAINRLRWIHNFVHSMGSGSLARRLTLQYHFRSRDEWTKEERQASKRKRDIDAEQQTKDALTAEKIHEKYEGFQVNVNQLKAASAQQRELEKLINSFAGDEMRLPVPGKSAKAGVSQIEVRVKAVATAFAGRSIQEGGRDW